MNYKSPLVSCIECRQEKSAKGIFSHYISSHTESGKINRINSGKLSQTLESKLHQKHINESKKQQKKNEYELSPKHCLLCNIQIDFEFRNNKFCSQSCATRFNNLNAPPTRKRGPTKKPKIIKKPVHKETIPFCKLFHNICFHCNLLSLSNTYKKYCNNCKSNYSDNGRVPYYFKFNIYNYPNLFDLSLIEKHGWFSNGKNGSAMNISGVSRDHKVSVNDAIRNGYDPYYISHVMNCDLVFHRENQKKNSKSSITYTELVKLVDDYDIMNGPSSRSCTCTPLSK